MADGLLPTPHSGTPSAGHRDPGTWTLPRVDLGSMARRRRPFRCCRRSPPLWIPLGTASYTLDPAGHHLLYPEGIIGSPPGRPSAIAGCHSVSSA
ncbi:hypothetical protein E2562_038374 [Oryza meyeriana var. granulata]|uniref:Uncharacterized protein n=1 Tax=Oryza meyeriana var. granulata TaxID=110450 RepID=A0A6G1F235_9ORYZ|nr:hypothetical protein E2562_038374 [Oryza meyeriana var. granulata]